MKITKIEAQVKTPGRYSVFIDNKFCFGISESGLLEGQLHAGQVLTAVEVETLKSDAKTDKIFQQALALLMRRPRSKWEMQTYLKQKKVDEEVSSQVMEMLMSKDFIDDLDFARRWVENRRLLKAISKRKLSLELKQKRVSEDIISQVISEDNTEDVDVLRQEIEKKQRQSRYKDETKLMQYLARQGYRYEDIKKALSD